MLGYHDRAVTARVVPHTLKSRVLYLYGTWIAATNNPGAVTSAQLDRVVMDNVNEMAEVKALRDVDIEAARWLPFVPIPRLTEAHRLWHEPY